jgi:Tol biopolymer transport system component
VYASDASGSANIWSMNADGTDQHQLTENFGRSYSPAISPDGASFAFHSNRDGNWNLWRMDFASRTPVRLTEGTRDSNWPQFTPDGKWVVYHHTGLNAMFNIWKAPYEGGGSAVQLTNRLTMHPTVSPQDGRIASWYSADTEKPNWKIAIFGPEGGSPLRLFDVPSTVVYDSRLRWTSDGEGITYIDNRNGIGNVWVQPLDGKPARQLTSFTWGKLYSYDWSRDGRLVYSRGITTSDVVLIRDIAKPKPQPQS